MPRFLKTGLLLWVLAVLAGCSGMPSTAELRSLDMPQPTRQQLDQVLSGRALLGEAAASVELPAEDIFGLSDEMQQFLDLYVSKRAGDDAKLRQLLRAIFHKGILGLEYDPFKTYTAGDTFYYQVGNCLSFTVMFVAMARKVGIDVYINEVDVPPIWEMQDEDTVTTDVGAVT